MSAALKYNEWDVPSPDEQVTREARWNMERAKMTVLHPVEWPTGAQSDEKLYSLECSRAADLESWDFGTDFEDALTETPALGSDFALTKPELTRIEGTYQKVAEYAKKLNDTQGAVVHWVYTPVLIEQQRVT